MTNEYVLDACALIALINDEEGTDKVESVLMKALDTQADVFMNKLNIYEVYYGILRDEGQQKADEVYNLILNLPINIIDAFTDEVFINAARLKSKYRMSVADSITLGEAFTRDALFVTADHHEFDSVEHQEQIQFYWIR
jgi:PIN domain nuclease of toxin-antitoxin system